MNKDACFELGYIAKKHGLQGEVSIQLDTDEPENYSELESVFVEIEQRLVPFFIDTISINGDRALVKFEEVDDVESAEALKGAKIFLPVSVLPPLKGKNFYFHEVIDFKVIDKKYGLVGSVKDVLDASAQNLFLVLHNDREVLIPVIDDIIEKIDRQEKVIYIEMPEGLLEIYLE